MYPLLRSLLLLLLAFCSYESYGSHVIGGEMTYRYKGDTTVSGTACHKYEINLVLYQDCLNGQPEAIAQDNPAYLSIFKTGSTTPIYIDTNLYYSSSELVTPAFSSACGASAIPSYAGCTLKKTFIRTYLLPITTTANYTVSYQRCCRASGILNINESGDVGVTYFCTIPGFTINSSAKFTHAPPQLTCVHMPMYIDQSATDLNWDSLSYELCPAYQGASNANIKPIPMYPADFATYVTTFSGSNPISSSLMLL